MTGDKKKGEGDKRQDNFFFFLQLKIEEDFSKSAWEIIIFTSLFGKYKEINFIHYLIINVIRIININFNITNYFPLRQLFLNIKI